MEDWKRNISVGGVGGLDYRRGKGVCVCKAGSACLSLRRRRVEVQE